MNISQWNNSPNPKIITRKWGFTGMNEKLNGRGAMIAILFLFIFQIRVNH